MRCAKIETHRLRRMSSVLEALKESAGRYELLTAEQEIELGRLIQAWQQWPNPENPDPDRAPHSIRLRGQRALDAFVLANQRLALHEAKKFQGHGVPLEDLTMAAMEGMITAFKRYDPTRGFRSSSYSVWYARSALQQLLQIQATAIRLPAALLTQARKLTRAQGEFRRETGRAANLAELSALTGISEAVILEVERALRINQVLTIDQTCDTDERGTVSHDVIGEDNTATLEEHDLLQCLFRAIETAPLTPQQRYILRWQYLQTPPLSSARIASDLNCSAARIEQLQQQAISVLRLDPLLADWHPAASSPVSVPSSPASSMAPTAAA